MFHLPELMTSHCIADEGLFIHITGGSCEPIDGFGRRCGSANDGSTALRRSSLECIRCIRAPSSFQTKEAPKM